MPSLETKVARRATLLDRAKELGRDEMFVEQCARTFGRSCPKVELCEIQSEVSEFLLTRYSPRRFDEQKITAEALKWDKVTTGLKAHVARSIYRHLSRVFGG